MNSYINSVTYNHSLNQIKAAGYLKCIIQSVIREDKDFKVDCFKIYLPQVVVV